MKLKDGFIVRKISNVSYAVAVGERSAEFNGMVKLTGIGEFLWNKLQSEISMDELVKAVTDNYSVDADKARADAEAFVNKLREANLFE